MLRQDPDVILVGEMRDGETIDVAIRAALTGHLVFSTLHTNDAVGAIARLLDMDVNPALTASTVVAVVAQRLVRKICVQCRTETVPDEAQLQSVGLSAVPVPLAASGASPQTQDERVVLGGANRPGKFYKGKGCPHCLQSGYKGRLGIFELLTVSPAIAQMISQRSPSHAVLEKAREEGMVTMLEDGIEKASRGVTTLDEIIRVAYTP
jgi:type II secretory ATPase GspE/PulE/Tfp pilus assembly ATPase PilB-like protein